MAEPPVLSARALNRATLARQFLLERTTMPAIEVVAHLIGMQAQLPNPPYTGLWSRINGFTAETLSEHIKNREVVRIALMRSTIHLTTANDALLLRRWLQPMMQRLVGSYFANALNGIDPDELVRISERYLDDAPLTLGELGDKLADHWPDHDVQALYNAARGLIPMVQVPPRGLWGSSAPARHVRLESWLGSELDTPSSTPELVRRYLAAFGPATVQDMQRWCAMTRLGATFTQLRSELMTWRDEAGRELFDLPDAPRPDPATDAPPRLLAEWDNILLSHDERSRLIDRAHYTRIYTKNGVMPGPVLVDGFVAGTWRVQQAKSLATLTISPWQRMSRADTKALQAEAIALVRFAAPTSSDHQVTIDP